MFRHKLSILAGLLSLITAISAHSMAFAYGSAEQPLAQLEFSANCNNPDYELCQFFGTGGIWFWIEVDANGTGDIQGAVCGHTVGGGGARGGPIGGEITWEYTTLAAGIAAGGEFYGTTDPNDQYYLV